ncbi:MAG: NUDIX domain-containing protein [Gemmatimonadaceae bacterium]|nr:NUDIX domain-containing protein [Gemmatimonadaceae bacterium]
MTTPSVDVIRVVAAVVRRDDALLVCQRPLHKQHGGLWEFAGGKCEPGESDRDAIARELHEELGVAVCAVGLPLYVARDPGGAYEIVFLPVEITGEVVAHEHTALGWFSTATLVTMPLAPSDAAFVRSLGA